MPPIKLRFWLYAVLIAGVISAIARYDLWIDQSSSALELYLVWPGWFATVLLGASPHGGELGHGWDYLVIGLVGGLVWGSLLFVTVGAARLLVRKPAA